MKLYYTTGTCSLAVRITINELKLSATYQAVNLKTKQLDDGQDYLSINPKGSVPCLALDNGQLLSENTVIQQYLADHNPTSQTVLAPQADFSRYRTLEWLNFISTDLHKTIAPLFNPETSDASKDKVFIPLLKKRLNYINAKLGGKYFLVNNHFTIADSYLFVVLSWLPKFKFQLSDWPALQLYFNHLLNYPSVKQSLQEEGLHYLPVQ
jgi:glutathione S-transferase